MMLNIYIARHGQDEDNANGLLNGHRNTPLTNIGVNQANQLANDLKIQKIKFDKIYSSPLTRAYQTATVISEVLGLTKPTKNDLLIEREFGVMTGLPLNCIENRCAPNIIKTKTVTYFLKPQGAETFPEVLERAERLLNFLKSEHLKGNILLVTHSDIGKMVYCAYYNLNWREFLPKFHFGNSDLLILSPDSPPEESHVVKLEQFNL